MDKKQLLLLSSGIVIGCIIGILLSAFVVIIFYMTDYSNDITEDEASTSECENTLATCNDEHSSCEESLAVCSNDLNICLGKGGTSSRSNTSTTVPGRQSSSQQEGITTDRVKNFVNRLSGISYLSSDALFILDITDVGKYTVRKTSSGIQVSKGGSSSKDIVIGMSRYHFEMLESSSNLCEKARKLYDEEPKKVWFEEPDTQKLCSKGYLDMYSQCFSGSWWERQAIKLAC